MPTILLAGSEEEQAEPAKDPVWGGHSCPPLLTWFFGWEQNLSATHHGPPAREVPKIKSNRSRATDQEQQIKSNRSRTTDQGQLQRRRTRVSALHGLGWGLN